MKTTDETRPKSEKWSCFCFYHGGAENCRGAIDTVHCCVWWKDKFHEFRVFRNCGR